MDAVLDKDAAAFRAVPEPVLRPEPLVGRVVLEIAVQEGAQRCGRPAPDRVEERVVRAASGSWLAAGLARGKWPSVSSACSTVTASGFSQMTCLPCWSAASDCS